ncbi:2,3-diaminopropionate biosynthesis protein SbnB [Nocardia sputorum]|uniref:2,3-diaminopropionate biosynthesis protein SbnB n=1 Tax=Nocardia TaxID=1817 RepID=UPI0024564E1E|nr:MULTISPECIES: 2,3-diaminopropionate biosynthesis protein SbnB [Nocardia]BDT94141.1 2,3-diaminopropionate biosynthesis protein SbnB [Nocardia sputorum]
MSTADNTIRILTGPDVAGLLRHRRRELVDVIRTAYESHERGLTVLPHSSFLRFPSSNNRIIALPALLTDDASLAGIKWIASFPSNIAAGIERASAAMVLNSTENGRPYCFMEGSVVSAMRTAASAALAALTIGPSNPDILSVIGCGLINYETCRFLTEIVPSIRAIYLYDVAPERAAIFAGRLGADWEGEIVTLDSVDAALEAARLISIATTAVTPYIGSANLQPAATVLHISLRDLSPQFIRHAVNVVDDRSHVEREGTSIDLAARDGLGGSAVFCTLGALLNNATVLPDNEAPVVFSPFGLGVLDIAVANYAYEMASGQNIGLLLPDFAPRPWHAPESSRM